MIYFLVESINQIDDDSINPVDKIRMFYRRSIMT